MRTPFSRISGLPFDHAGQPNVHVLSSTDRCPVVAAQVPSAVVTSLSSSAQETVVLRRDSSSRRGVEESLEVSRARSGRSENGGRQVEVFPLGSASLGRRHGPHKGAFNLSSFCFRVQGFVTSYVTVRQFVAREGRAWHHWGAVLVLMPRSHGFADIGHWAPYRLVGQLYCRSFFPRHGEDLEANLGQLDRLDLRVSHVLSFLKQDRHDKSKALNDLLNRVLTDDIKIQVSSCEHASLKDEHQLGGVPPHPQKRVH